MDFLLFLQPVCKKILTRLYRVFVHVYVHHFDRMMVIGNEKIGGFVDFFQKSTSFSYFSGAEPHVNTCYKHFYYFVTEFNLMNDKEFEPLKEMTKKICTDLGQQMSNLSVSSPSKAASKTPAKPSLPSTVEERYIISK